MDDIEKNTKLLSDHLSQKKVRLKKCPMCDADDWRFSGVVGAIMMEMQNGTDAKLSPTNGIPYAIVHCGNCYYMISFAWRPIAGGQSNG